MNRTLFGTVCALLIAALASPVSTFAADEAPDVDTAPKAEAKAGGPKFVVSDKVYDFGVLRAGDVELVTHTFAFENAGTEELVLIKVKASCGCTSAIPSATRIAPGETGSLTAAMKPKGKFGNTSVTVRIETNDPATPREVLKITGTILSPWRVLPSFVDFRGVGKGEIVEKSVKVQSQYFEGDERHKIVKVHSDDPAIVGATEAYTPPADPLPGKKHLEYARPVKITLHAGDEIGQKNAKVLVATDDPKSPTHFINVRWKVEGDLAISLKRVTVYRRAGKNNQRAVAITSRTDQPFDVLSVDVIDRKNSPSVLEIVAAEGNTPSKKTYLVSVSDKTPAGRPYVGEIVFTTNHPEMPRIKVPYTASVVGESGAKKPVPRRPVPKKN